MSSRRLLSWVLSEVGAHQWRSVFSKSPGIPFLPLPRPLSLPVCSGKPSSAPLYLPVPCTLFRSFSPTSLSPGLGMLLCAAVCLHVCEHMLFPYKLCLSSPPPRPSVKPY